MIGVLKPELNQLDCMMCAPECFYLFQYGSTLKHGGVKLAFTAAPLISPRGLLHLCSFSGVNHTNQHDNKCFHEGLHLCWQYPLKLGANGSSRCKQYQTGRFSHPVRQGRCLELKGSLLLVGRKHCVVFHMSLSQSGMCFTHTNNICSCSVLLLLLLYCLSSLGLADI